MRKDDHPSPVKSWDRFYQQCKSGFSQTADQRLDRKSQVLYHASVRTHVRTIRHVCIGRSMEQALTFHLAINGTSPRESLRSKPIAGRPSDRILVRPDRTRRRHFPSPRRKIAESSSAQRQIIRLQPIVGKPLQPYVLRESACDYLECRAAGRRCIVSSGREVDLGYQVAYCLGSRHQSCPLYVAANGVPSKWMTRRAAYAIAVIAMCSLILVAVARASGAGDPAELARAVGLS